MITSTTIRTAKALVWACALTSVIIIGIGTAQPTITFRAIIFAIALLPAAAAILIGSFINDHYCYRPEDVETWLEKRAASKQLCRRHMQAIHWRKPRPTQGNTTHDKQD